MCGLLSSKQPVTTCKKDLSKAKGVLTLIFLPKIDEIYARLKGSKIFSTFDMRSGHHHMALSKNSRPKTAFVYAYGKWELKRPIWVGPGSSLFSEVGE